MSKTTVTFLAASRSYRKFAPVFLMHVFIIMTVKLLGVNKPTVNKKISSANKMGFVRLVSNSNSCLHSSRYLILMHKILYNLPKHKTLIWYYIFLFSPKNFTLIPKPVFEGEVVWGCLRLSEAVWPKVTFLSQLISQLTFPGQSDSCSVTRPTLLDKISSKDAEHY